MSDSSDKPKVSSATVTVHDAYRPALTAGLHRIVVQQSVGLSPGKGVGTGAENHHYYRDDRFIVRGPRYLVEAADIHSRYPAEGAVGDFERHIPYIVLRKRALPWERALTIKDAPWMALLLLTEAEYGAVGDGGVGRTLKWPELIAPAADGSVTVPKLPDEGDASDDKMRANVIELDRALFARICPSRRDLRLLAHLRDVATHDKPRLDMHGEGDFAVVTANRIPAQGANVALLVSLEGHEEAIGAKLQPGKVRLIVLARWRFVHDPRTAYSFGSMSRGLDLGMLRPPVAADLPRTLARPLAAGHSPMNYRLLDGSATLAWYRGPFAPAPPRPLALEEFTCADAAMVVDRDDGTLTLSYAAAWQLGRLLALSAQSFIEATRIFVGDDAGPREIAFRLDNFMRNHHEAIRREWAVKPGQASGSPVAATGPFRAGFTMIRWLEGLMRLERIPFNYLVPDQRSLPPGSIRFFHVDDDWVLALVNGALSLGGVATSEDAGRDPGLRVQLSRLMDRCLARDKAVVEPAGRYLTHGKTGFLMRSPLVSGWPGLEVTLASATAPLRPLRLERLADDVLLGLVEGRIASLTLKEPPEGVRLMLPDRPDVGVAGGVFSPRRLIGERDGIAKGPARDVGGAAFAAAVMTSGITQTFRWE